MGFIPNKFNAYNAGLYYFSQTVSDKIGNSDCNLIKILMMMIIIMIMIIIIIIIIMIMII